MSQLTQWFSLLCQIKSNGVPSKQGEAALILVPAVSLVFVAKWAQSGQTKYIVRKRSTNAFIGNNYEEVYHSVIDALSFPGHTVLDITPDSMIGKLY